MILNDLKALRRQIPSFKRLFQEQVSNAISNAKLEVAIHGILVSLCAIIIGTSIDIFQAFPLLLQMGENFLSAAWPLGFVILGLSVSIFIGFGGLIRLLRMIEGKCLPERLVSFFSRLFNRS